jgi:hypothetical protein
MEMFVPKTVLLTALAALSYATATYGIKLASHSPGVTSLIIIVTGLALAVGAETVLLRHASLGIVYLAVIAVETLLVLVLAASLGEGLTLRQFGGAALVLAGLAVLTQ